ncbi:MAG TPA: tRNA lysidine(34) synthetase TilS, partial [Chitinophagaceae bacterium]
MEFRQRFEDHIKAENLFSPKDRLLLAVSGGVDSVVLCHLCKQAGLDFIIVHCNFKLRGEDSERDEQFVKELAASYNVPFYSKSFDTKILALTHKKNIEETARDLRYEWFYELLNTRSSPIAEAQLPKFIVTGHHADDNIETVVMNFFRGTGIKGMRGMLPKNGKIIRPLLFARRKEVEEYASLHQLEYVSDHTNFENEYARNFFRNRVLPMVREFFPQAEQNILHNTERFSGMEQLYSQAIAVHKKKLLEQKGA